jgi:hypothetical protein
MNWLLSLKHLRQREAFMGDCRAGRSPSFSGGEQIRSTDYAHSGINGIIGPSSCVFQLKPPLGGSPKCRYGVGSSTQCRRKLFALCYFLRVPYYAIPRGALFNVDFQITAILRFLAQTYVWSISQMPPNHRQVELELRFSPPHQ